MGNMCMLMCMLMWPGIRYDFSFVQFGLDKFFFNLPCMRLLPRWESSFSCRGKGCQKLICDFLGLCFCWSFSGQTSVSIIIYKVCPGSIRARDKNNFFKLHLLFLLCTKNSLHPKNSLPWVEQGTSLCICLLQSLCVFVGSPYLELKQSGK